MKTITINELSKISEHDYELAKNVAKTELEKMYEIRGVRIEYSPKLVYISSNIDIRAKDIAFRNREYSNCSYIIKCIIASNIAFMNDELFIKILIDNGYNLGKLMTLIRFTEQINLFDIQNLDLNTMKITSNELKHIKRICQLTKKFFNVDDYLLVINKITEIIVFKQDLFSKVQSDIKKLN